MKYPPIEMPTGIKDAAAWIEFARDTKKYTKLTKDIVELIGELNVCIEAVGKVKEIETLRLQAYDKKREADAALVHAGDKARDLVSDAEMKNKLLQADLDKRAAVFEEKITEIVRKTNEDRRQVQDERAALGKRLKDVSEREVEVSARERRIGTGEEELARKQGAWDKLKAELG